MSQEMKKNLHVYTTSLMDNVDYLKMTGANADLTELLSRAANIGNIAILYFSTLSEEEVQSVVSTLNIASSIADNMQIAEEKSGDLLRVIESVEALFRSKKLLLDGLGEKSLV